MISIHRIPMHKAILVLLSPIILTTLPITGLADDKPTSKDKLNEKCPIEGNIVAPDHVYQYEGAKYAFCSEECLQEFAKARTSSLYHKIGGKTAINAAVDLFYKKVMDDDRVNHFFEDVNMRRQHNKQKEFIGAALGGPTPWTGKDMRKIHSSLDLTESDFGVIAGHLQSTLEELKVDPELIKQVMTVIGSTKDDVLNRRSTSE